MKQYCRYCCHCHYNEIDVFYMGDMDKTYKPRELKQKQCDGQIELFGKG